MMLTATSSHQPIQPQMNKKLSEKAKNKLNKIVIRPDGSIKPFSEISVSTCTLIVITNLSIDLGKLFTYTPITDYAPPKKRRGRKKRNSNEKPIPKLPFGSVIQVQHELNIRNSTTVTAATAPPTTSTSAAAPSTTATRKRKVQAEEEAFEKTNKRAFFLHCVVLKIIADPNDDKPDKNVKIYRNGKFQITGCKNTEQCVNTVRAIFDLFHQIEQYTGERIITCTEPRMKAVFNTVMQNRDFYMGFNIFRDKLDQFINTETDYISIFESAQSTHVNIKIPIESCEENLLYLEYDPIAKTSQTSYVPRSDYLPVLSKKTTKTYKSSEMSCSTTASEESKHEHTFLVFASGHVIFTSIPGKSMEEMYYRMIELLIKHRKHFEEKSDTLQSTQKVSSY